MTITWPEERTPPQAPRRRRRCDERGAVAGLEMLPFGVLVFVGITLLGVTVWATIARRADADLLAESYLRAYTQSSSPATAHRNGVAAVERTAGDLGLPEGQWAIDAPDARDFGPCSVAQVRVRLDVPVIKVPFAGPVGVRNVTSVQRELVDPFRAADAGSAYRRSTTVCDD